MNGVATIFANPHVSGIMQTLLSQLVVSWLHFACKPLRDHSGQY